MIKPVLVALAVAAALHLLATAALFAAQRRLIYPAPPAGATPPAPGFRAATLRTADGLALAALHRPAERGLPTLVFLHGNGDSLTGAYVATAALGRAGYGVLLPEYRGYGGNPGAPDEEGLYRDGEAALAWLAERGVPAARVVLVGNSLGSGVATELARRRRVGGLALVSGFTSLADVAAARMRLFPVRLLLRDRYENLAKLPEVDAPVLLLHGAADALIPLAHARALARAARRPTLVVVPGVGHELAYLPESQAALVDWLAGITPPAPSGTRPPPPTPRP